MRRAAKFWYLWITFFCGVCATNDALAELAIATVPVGNAFNNVDPTTRFGGVRYEYRIGTYEVTVGQYATFLNSVAAADPYGLYDPDMAADPNTASISRTGSPGSYSYSLISSPNLPITHVDWGDAVRFINWLNNGQPVGQQDSQTTEDGSYTLNGAMTNQELNSVVRNPDATWFLPTEDEWYKAAYHKNDGRTSNYWMYPTSNDVRPYSAKPPGTAAPTPSNTANLNIFELPRNNGWNDGYAVTGTQSLLPGRMPLSEVGAYANTVNPYGTFDQGGNVFEWTESKETGLSNTYRAMRGGSWISAAGLVSDQRSIQLPTLETNFLGFRVAGFAVVPVPEPSTLALAGIGSLGLLALGVRRRFNLNAA